MFKVGGQSVKTAKLFYLEISQYTVIKKANTSIKGTAKDIHQVL